MANIIRMYEYYVVVLFDNYVVLNINYNCLIIILLYITKLTERIGTSFAKIYIPTASYLCYIIIIQWSM